MITSQIIIRRAETPAELADVYKFRYLIYVKEMNRVQHYANHEKEIIVDTLDDGHCHDLVAYVDNEIVGVVRINFACDSNLEFYESFYQMQCVGADHPQSTAIITRLMIRPEYRSTTDLAVRLSNACFELGLEKQIKYAFMDCNDHLVKFFTGLGWYEYIGKIEHPEYGLVTPMRLDLLDIEHFRAIKSPFLGVLENSCKKIDAKTASDFCKYKWKDAVMLILRCLLLIILFLPFSLLLASLSRIVQFFSHIGLSNYVFAMKFGTTAYSFTSKFLLCILGIKVPPVIFNSGSFVIANHVSWLDGFVLAATHRCTIVTKGELSSIPYVGFLLKGFGSIPLDDNPANVLKALNMCHECLDNGISVLIFPEGTTGSQHSLGHFHSLFFDVAIKRSQPVCVAAIHYDVNSSNAGFPCWIGSEYLFHNMTRVLKVLPLGVSVKLDFEEIQSENYQRKELAEKARTVCGQLLGISIETQPHLNEIAHNFVDSYSEFDVENSHSLSIIKDILIEYWVNEGLMDSSEIDIDKTFTQLHIDSLGIVTIGIELERRINKNLNIKTAYLYDTPRKLAMYLDSE